MRKKLLTLAVATVAASSLLTGCGGSSSNDKKAASDENITAVSREDGSGTRGAFIELFGIEQKDKDGNKVDKTTSSVQITNSTSVMMTTVAENKAAIGYIYRCHYRHISGRKHFLAASLLCRCPSARFR